MDWNQSIEEYKSYLKIERGLSLNSIVSYENDILSLKNYILENKIKDFFKKYDPKFKDQEENQEDF